MPRRNSIGSGSQSNGNPNSSDLGNNGVTPLSARTRSLNTVPENQAPNNPPAGTAQPRLRTRIEPSHRRLAASPVVSPPNTPPRTVEDQSHSRTSASLAAAIASAAVRPASLPVTGIPSRLSSSEKGESSGSASRSNESHGGSRRQTTRMERDDHKNKEVSAIDDLRHTAYAYQKAVMEDKGDENGIRDILNEMDTNHNDRISFLEFKSYMEAKGYGKYCSDDRFFNKLACERGYLKYCDVVTLLYVVNSGRPYCSTCKFFIQGSFFTCTNCFEIEKDYHYNLCPSCFNDKETRHGHSRDGQEHKDFVDPLSLLRLKAKIDQRTPKNNHPSGLLELMQIAAGCATTGAAVTQCTIM